MQRLIKGNLSFDFQSLLTVQAGNSSLDFQSLLTVQASGFHGWNFAQCIARIIIAASRRTVAALLAAFARQLQQ